MLLFVILQVDFVPNFDYSQKEPSLLPTRVSSLLLNGYSVIAVWVCIHFIQVLLSQTFIYAKMGFFRLFKLFQVGMATNIPHNLGELVDALSVIIQTPEATVSNLYHISWWVQYYLRLFEKALSCYFSIFLWYCDGKIVVGWCSGRCAILLGGGHRRRGSNQPMLL